MATFTSLTAVAQDYSRILFGYSTKGPFPVGASELTGWATQLDAGTISNNDVIAALTGSPIALNVIDPIVRLYQVALGRAPDPNGLLAWVGAVETGGFTLQQVAQGFLQSPEFAAHYGGVPGSTALITALYQQALNRAPDPAGLQVQQAALSSGAVTVAQLLLNFATSAEFVTASAPSIRAWQTDYAATGVQSPLYIGNATEPPTLPTNATSFTLTTGNDTGFSFTGSPLDDTYNGTLVFSAGALQATSTLNPGDSLDGRAGIDTLNVAISGASLPTYTATAQLAGIEKVLAANSSSDTAHAVTFDLSQADSALTTIGTNSSTTAGVSTNFTNVGTLAGLQMAGPGDLSAAYVASVVAGGSDTVAVRLNGVGTNISTLSTLTIDNRVEKLSIVSASSPNFLKVVDSGLNQVSLAGSLATALDLTANNGAVTVDSTGTTSSVVLQLGNGNNVVSTSAVGTNTITTGTGTTTVDLHGNTAGVINVGVDAGYGTAPTTPNLVVSHIGAGDRIVLTSLTTLHVEYIPGLLGQGGSIAGTIANLENSLATNHPGVSAFALDIYGGDTFVVASLSGGTLGASDTTIVRLVGYTGTVSWNGVDNILHLS